MQATRLVRRLAAFALLLFLLTVLACAPAARDPSLEKALALLDEIRAVNLREFPLRDLAWYPLAPGQVLQGRELVLTTPASRLTLQIPGGRSALQVEGYFPLASQVSAAARGIRVEGIEGEAWWCRPPLGAPWLPREVPVRLQRGGPPGGWGFTGRQVQPGTTAHPGLESPGVAVTFIFLDTPAHRLGLRPGDVILAVDGQQTTTPEQLGARLRGRSQAALHVFRWPVIWRGTLRARPGPDRTGPAASPGF